MIARASFATSLLVLAAWLAPACSSTAPGVDACRTIETTRCDKLSACSPDFPGDPASCERFYQVQCGRGLSEGSREPSSKELDRCVAAIKGSCDIASEPNNAPECAVFLGTGPSDAGADAADAPVDAPADTGSAPGDGATDAVDGG